MSDTVIARYTYRDAIGDALYRKVRTEDKQFRFERLDSSGGWTSGLGSIQPSLYRMPEVLQGIRDGEMIYIVEGEKDADRLIAEGLVATSSSRGAGDWEERYLRTFAGAREIVVIPDNDEPGLEHAEEIAESLNAAGFSTKVLLLPDLPAHGDASDYLDRGGTADEITSLAEAHPTWAPPEPIPIGASEPVSLPVDALPPIQRRFVETVSASTQTPPDMCVMLVLAVLAVAVQGKAIVQVASAWREVLNIFVAVIASPATRKSAVYSLVLQPIDHWEHARALETTLMRKMRQDEQGVLEAQLKNLLKKAAKEGFGDDLRDEHEDARRQLEEHRVPPEPRLNAPSSTPEALPMVAAEQGGRIAVLSPEGDALGHLDGRYAARGHANLEFSKKAWGGEAYRDDRVVRESVKVPRPALTYGLCLQPGVIDRLNNADAFRGEGMLGRFLMVVPESRVGFRLTGPDVPHLDSDAVADAYQSVSRLLELTPDRVDEDGSYFPRVLAMSEAASRRLNAFQREVEEELRPGNRLGGISDWAGKLVGNTVRLAALMHVAHHMEWSTISGKSMARAIRLALTPAVDRAHEVGQPRTLRANSKGRL